MMSELEHRVRKNSYGILLNECAKITLADVEKMKRLNQVNCLHKGNYSGCKGQIYMVGVDGSSASEGAFDTALRMMDRTQDHLFLVTIRERPFRPQSWFKDGAVILAHQVWRGACDIAEHYQDIAKQLGIEYTTLVPEAKGDSRKMMCALVKQFKVDVLVLGKHPRGEKHHVTHFRSFSSYCQKNAKCPCVYITDAGAQSAA